MVVIHGKHGANDTYLVFDPMRRDGKTDGSGIFETDCASVSYFEYLQQVADFVARRFANLSVTQFSFSIVATNGSGGTSGGTSGGDTKTSEKEVRDGEEEGQLDPSLRLRRMAREKANTQKLNLKAKLISSRRRSVFKSNIMSGAIEDDGGGNGGGHASKAALQSFKHWRTLYLSMFQGTFVFLTFGIMAFVT